MMEVFFPLTIYAFSLFATINIDCTGVNSMELEGFRVNFCERPNVSLVLTKAYNVFKDDKTSYTQRCNVNM